MLFVVGAWALLMLTGLFVAWVTRAPQALVGQTVTRSVTVSPVIFPRAAASQNTLSPEQRIEARRWLSAAWPLFVPWLLCAGLIGLVLYGGQIGYVTQRLRTQRATIGEFWNSGWRSLIPLMGSILLMLAGAVGVFAIGAFCVLLLNGLARLAPSWLVLVLGIVLTVGVIVGVMWWSIRLSWWAIAIVADRLGPVAGLKRSLQVTRGRWWRVFGLLICLSLIVLGVAVAIVTLAWAGRRMTGVGGQAIQALSAALKILSNLYLGFALTGACAQFYLDSQPTSTT